MNRRLIVVVTLACLPAAAPAQDSNEARRAQRPAQLEAVVQCRSITDDAARLQCFDTAVANLEQAAQRREIVVVDRAQVRETRRRLFGLPLPDFNLFGGDGDDEEEIDRLEAVVASASNDANGRWLLRLEGDAGTWVQTDDNPLAVWPRRGTNVEIRRGALGSYMMRVGGQPGIRVRRIG